MLICQVTRAASTWLYSKHVDYPLISDFSPQFFSFGFVKGHAVVSRRDIDAEEIEEVIEMFNIANSDAAFVDLFLSGKNSKDLIFKADTQRLLAVYPKTVEQYLGDEYSVYRDVVGLDTSVKLGTSGASYGKDNVFPFYT